MTPDAAQHLWSIATLPLRSAADFTVLAAIQAMNLRGYAPTRGELVARLSRHKKTARTSIYEAVAGLIQAKAIHEEADRRLIAEATHQHVTQHHHDGLPQARRPNSQSGIPDKPSATPDEKSAAPDVARAELNASKVVSTMILEKTTTAAAVVKNDLTEHAAPAREENSAAAAESLQELQRFAHEACKLNGDTPAFLARLAATYGVERVRLALEQYHYGFTARDRAPRDITAMLYSFARHPDKHDRLPVGALTVAKWRDKAQAATAQKARDEAAQTTQQAEIDKERLKKAQAREAEDKELARAFPVRPRDNQSAVLERFKHHPAMHWLEKQRADGFIAPSWEFAVAPDVRDVTRSSIAELERLARKNGL